MKRKCRLVSVIAIAAFAGLACSATGAFAQGKGKEVTLPSGVKIQMLKEGPGNTPTASDVVTVNYRGTLVNGTEFDSSYARGKSSSFPLKGVIRCWTEGVQKINVGGKAKLTCPANTAYGSRSPSALIPPNSTLIFEIELLSID